MAITFLNQILYTIFALVSITFESLRCVFKQFKWCPVSPASQALYFAFFVLRLLTPTCMHTHPILAETSGMKVIFTAAFTYCLAKTSCLYIFRKIQSKQSMTDRKYTQPHPASFILRDGKGMEEKNAGPSISNKIKQNPSAENVIHGERKKQHNYYVFHLGLKCTVSTQEPCLTNSELILHFNIGEH